MKKIIREELEDEITMIIYISSYSQYALKLFKLKPTKEQCAEIEIDYIIYELKGEYKNVYNKWKKNYNNRSI